MNDKAPTTAPAVPPGRSRKVEPVSEEFEPGEIFDPESLARPGLAALLMIGPVLAGVGTLGWLRLIGGVPLPTDGSPLETDVLGLIFDAFLVALFIVPHSLLARGFGRRWLNQALGPAAERPLYVLFAGATLSLLAFAWTTTGPLLWDIGGVLEIVMRGVQGTGLVLVLWGLWVSGAGSLLGVPHLRALDSGKPHPTAEFVALPPYRYLRQPMNLGFLMMFVMPELTLDRLILVIGFGVWILLAAAWEERESLLRFGEAYEVYRERTPRWIPRWRGGADS